MILNLVTGGGRKPEHIKHHHVDTFLGCAKDFLQMLGETFGAQWPTKTAKDEDTYRRLYVHGWPFALKALAIA